MKKLLVVLLCLCMLLSTVSCGAGKSPNGETSDAESTTEHKRPNEGSEDETEEEENPVVDFASYESILGTYRRMAKNALLRTDENADEYDAAFDFSDEAAYEEYLLIADAIASVVPEENAEHRLDYAYTYGYVEPDLNGDGLPELVLMTEDYCILAIYTISAYTRRPVLLSTFGDTSFAWIDREGHVRKIDYASYLLHCQSEYVILSNGTWEMKTAIGCNADGYFCSEAGTRRTVSWEEYSLLAKANPLMDRKGAADLTRVYSGLLFKRAVEVTEEHLGAIMQKYTDAMNGKEYVTDPKTKASVSLNEVCFTTGASYGSLEKAEYVFLDLDANGVSEVLIADEARNLILLYYYHGTLYALPYEGNGDVSGYKILKDGTFEDNGNAGTSVRKRVIFYYGGEYSETELCRKSGDGVYAQYSVNGVSVKRAEYEAYYKTMSTESCIWTVLEKTPA
ncbi:MAG: hypothetical protein J6B77_08935, partial [Clostridia bacterium]|nr:hypothetical protein [Clostridia bacterium]